MSIEWESCGLSDRGNTRKINQDAFWIGKTPGMIRGWAVADGMGGYKDGEVASIRLVEALDRMGPAINIERLGEEVQQSVREVNASLITFANESGKGLVGSTLVVFVASKEGKGICLWAGDSRLYRLRDGDLQQISRDHSQVQGLLDYGIITAQEAEQHPAANIVTNAVGIADVLQMEQCELEIREGDVYLLCSDGLNKELDDEEIARIMQLDSARQVVDTLIAGALENGGRDNVTAVCVRVKSDLDDTLKMVQG